jgi:hypothetical protein
MESEENSEKTTGYREKLSNGMSVDRSCFFQANRGLYHTEWLHLRHEENNGQALHADAHSHRHSSNDIYIH